MADRPDIALSYIDGISPSVFDQLVQSIRHPRLTLKVEAREQGPMAGVEWLLPTAVVLYIAKSYFDAFLQEAGREHYHAVKKGLSSLWSKFFGEQRSVRISAVSTPGKLQAQRKYSFALSLMAEGAPRQTFKLLLPERASAEELDGAVIAFLQFLADYHAGQVSPVMLRQLEAIPPMGGITLVAYDASASVLQVVDPRAAGKDS